MIWLLGRQGQAATLGQHCQWMTRKPGSWELTVRVWPFQDGRISAPNPARRGLRMHSYLPRKKALPANFLLDPLDILNYFMGRLRAIQNCKVWEHVGLSQMIRQFTRYPVCISIVFTSFISYMSKLFFGPGLIINFERKPQNTLSTISSYVSIPVRKMWKSCTRSWLLTKLQ